MSRLERKIFRLGDQIAAIERQEALVSEELAIHRHLHDDAQRDAVVSDHPLDRADARDTGADVARFERALEDLRLRRLKLVERRDRLLRRLG